MSDSSNGEFSGERRDGTVDSDESEHSPSSGQSIAYRAVMIAVVAFGLLAVVAGVGGTILVLMGGSDGVESDILGEYECDEFDADPGVVHDADYEIEREVLGPSELRAFNATRTDAGVVLSFETEGVLLDASANAPDGQPLAVDTNDTHATIERDTTEPFRIWIDSVAEDGTVTRMQLDICPPQEQNNTVRYVL